MLREIDFQKYADRDFSAFVPETKTAKDDVEALVNNKLAQLGSQAVLSARAVEYLKEDGFACSSLKCNREFYMKYEYGTAFLAGSINLGMVPESQETRR